MVKIAFWDNQLCERGTTQSLYDYAYFNKHLLNNESIILYFKNEPNNNTFIIKKFEKEFPVYGVEKFEEVDDILETTKTYIFYITKHGKNDNKISKKIKTVVHCVFSSSDPHGDVYAAISPWMHGNSDKIPIVPYIVKLLPETQEDMRQLLNIPSDALVFGRYGGLNQFNINFVHQVIKRVAMRYKNIYFLFANTNRFANLPNIIHINTITQEIDKRKFINTCDSMIHARLMGETFGSAIAEFSSCNKPVITCKKGDLAHVNMLGEKGIYYHNSYELYNIFTNFNQIKEELGNKIKHDWNAYRAYQPEIVMEKFKKVFIDS